MGGVGVGAGAAQQVVCLVCSTSLLAAESWLNPAPMRRPPTSPCPTALRPLPPHAHTHVRTHIALAHTHAHRPHRQGAAHAP